MRKFLTIALLLLLGFADNANAQANVLNPADPDLLFTSTYRPPAPAWNVISKWGHTNRNMGLIQPR